MALQKPSYTPQTMNTLLEYKTRPQPPIFLFARLLTILFFVVGWSLTTATPIRAAECFRELLPTEGWSLHASRGAAQAYQPNVQERMKGMDSLQVTLDFHGTVLLPDSRDGSAIILDQNGKWYTLNLTNYAVNGMNGPQTIQIPFTDFKEVDSQGTLSLNPLETIDTIHARIWVDKTFTVTISSIAAYSSVNLMCRPAGEPLPTPALPSPAPSPSPMPTPSPVATPVPTPVLPVSSPNPLPSELPSPVPTTTASPSATSVPVHSASTMKVTKDRVRNPLMESEIIETLKQSLDLGATHLSIETPYDNPVGGNSVSYTAQWISLMRIAGLKVWHRHMPIKFEGIYEQPVVARKQGAALSSADRQLAATITGVPTASIDQYQLQIYRYIVNHPTFFKAGDIFTPIPEPDARGIGGMSDCSGGCMFSSVDDFNEWIRNTEAITEQAFSKIGLKGKVQVGYWGFSGFTAAGLDNPDWRGRSTLDCETIAAMDGKVAIDHYPSEGETMNADIQEAIETLSTLCPTDFKTLAISEFGDMDPNVVRNSMQVFQQQGIQDINYWPLMGGEFPLLDEATIEPTTRFDVMQSFF